MKKVKLLLMVLAVISTVAIYSCGGNKQETTEPAATEQPAADQAPADTTVQAPAQE